MFKKKTLIIGLFALPVLITLSSKRNFNEKVNAIDTASLDYQEVDLQGELFKDYYDDLNDDVKELIDLDKFKDYYKKADVSANDLVEKLNHYEFKTIGSQTEIKGGIPAFIENIGTDYYRKEDDAFYIISDNHQGHNYGDNERPAPLSYGGMTYNSDKDSVRNFDFGDYCADKPYYSGSNLSRYRSFLQEGDLVWDGVTKVAKDDNDLSTHIGMVVNKNKTGTRKGVTFEYIETIEAYVSGVRFGYFDDERILKEGTKILRVYASTDQKRTARDFMYSQLGKPYTLKVPDLNLNGVPVPGANASTWYCTQLVHSAYYSAGINICEYYDENYYGKNGKVYFNVIGDMIYRSPNVYAVSFENEHPLNQFLTLDVRGFDGSNYTVRILNKTSTKRMVGYTPQKRSFGSLTTKPLDQSMRFIEIEANSYQTVKIYGDSNYAIQAFFIEDNKIHCTIAHRMMEVGYYNRSIYYCLQFNYIATIGVDVERERTFFPKLFVSGKDGAWQIGVANLSNFDFTSSNFEYNTKMCNSGDAKNWTGLKNLNSGSVPKHTFRVFNVSTNFWATHVTFSVTKNKIRYIGYGDCLNSGQKTMAFYQNKKAIK